MDKKQSNWEKWIVLDILAKFIEGNHPAIWFPLAFMLANINQIK